MPEETCMGVPRGKIPWYPRINHEKCNLCDGDLLSLKVEIASFIKNLRAADEQNDLLAEAQGMLIDSTKIIEESRWHPFRPKKLML